MKFILLATVFFSALVASAPADTETNKAPTQNVTPSLGSETNILTRVGYPGPGSSIRATEVISERESQIQQNLDDLFEQLVGYTATMLFYFQRFESESSNLGNTIKKITKDIETLEPRNLHFLVQIRFAQNVYQDMLSALSLYKAFPVFGSQNHSILRNLVQMNACLFTLRDHYGTPDPSIKNYESWVSSCLGSLEYNLSSYGQNEKPSKALDSVFKIQLGKLRDNLSELSAMTSG